ncbi:MAG TPA: putative lipid II flippase FtsW [Candidatus Omnitrophota bacterium]|nr:putative lipid II flippase FtsW [Candidatus Omnitrophota bacterium]HQO38305.1 putative lipid II flippase FtsW [Candidatus Omnitrophota bacterium]HQQ06181.1 putative lipid II flippase FtsW [Candidatus Omnitrophota bacterium]
MTSMMLICIGIVMIYSASGIYALNQYKDGMFFLKRHLMFILIGLAATFFVMAFDYRKLKKYARPALWVAVFLLVLVLVPHIGREVSGARRWFRFKFISFQPSSFACIALIVYVADFIERKGNFIRTIRWGLAPVMAVLGLISGLILIEPDLGTTLALGAVVFIMLYVSGVRLTYLGTIIVSFIPALYLLIFSVPYRRMRILAFLNPWADPRGSGFQIIQSQVALGSGGIFGTGLGHSQQKLFYLPAAHTDFIFSIIGEELGLIGTIGVIILFVLFIKQGLMIAKHAPDMFGYFLALGLVLLISLKAMVNIGVSCGILPTKGLPLPFISYGGSSFIFDMVSVGLLMNIGRAGEYP